MLPQTVSPELLLTTQDPTASAACLDFSFRLHQVCVSNSGEIVFDTTEADGVRCVLLAR